MQKSGELIADIFDDDLQTSDKKEESLKKRSIYTPAADLNGEAGQTGRQFVEIRENSWTKRTSEVLSTEF